MTKALGDQAACEFGTNFETAWKALSETGPRTGRWAVLYRFQRSGQRHNSGRSYRKPPAAREFIERLRRDKDGRNIPVIALSTSDDERLGELLRTSEFGELRAIRVRRTPPRLPRSCILARRPVPRVELRILMPDSDDGRWDIDRKGEGSSTVTCCCVPQRAFTELADKSEKIGEPGVDWPKLLQEVSEKLYNVIFERRKCQAQGRFLQGPR